MTALAAEQQGHDPVEEEIRNLDHKSKLKLGIGEARAMVERTIGDAQRWATYYQRKAKGAPKVATKRKEFGRAASSEAARLRELVSQEPPRMVDRRAPADHPLSKASLATLAEDAIKLAERIEQVAKACNEPAPGIRGRPSDAWLLGFIWGMAVGWLELTTAKIAPRAHFPRLLQAALARIEPDCAPDLEPLVKTAIKRFALDQQQWLRPGDDLARAPSQHFSSRKSPKIS
jgi:hypothetical protein